MNRIRVSQKLPWGGGYLSSYSLLNGRNINVLRCKNLVLSCFLCGNNFFAYCFSCENRMKKRIEKDKNIWYTINVHILDGSVRV